MSDNIDDAPLVEEVLQRFCEIAPLRIHMFFLYFKNSWLNIFTYRCEL